MAAAERYIALVTAAGGSAEVTTSQGSIIATFDLPQGKLYPMTLSHYGKGSIQLCLGYLISKPAFASEAARQDLLDRLTAIVGPLSTSTLNGFPKFSATKLNDPAVADHIREFLAYVRQSAEA